MTFWCSRIAGILYLWIFVSFSKPFSFKTYLSLSQIERSVKLLIVSSTVQTYASLTSGMISLGTNNFSSSCASFILVFCILRWLIFSSCFYRIVCVGALKLVFCTSNSELSPLTIKFYPSAAPNGRFVRSFLFLFLYLSLLSFFPELPPEFDTLTFASILLNL